MSVATTPSPLPSTGVSSLSSMVVRKSDASVHGRTPSDQAQVASGDVPKSRHGHRARRRHRELDTTAVVHAVALIEGRIGVADLCDGLDDVVAHGQDVGVAAGVADEALAGRARHQHRVVVQLRAPDGPVAAPGTARDGEDGRRERRPNLVVRVNVVGRSGSTELREGVVLRATLWWMWLPIAP